jgi:predicted molibdopterin-dependent oxidoreductase YjgC
MITDGMKVKTETPEIIRARKAVLEFLLINHPLDCPSCDKAGECGLQDYTMVYGPAEGRFKERKRTKPESLEDPLIVRNMERCIMCTRCVRICAGIQGASALAVVGRGKNSYVEPFSGGHFDCDYCGNCISVCPVGSLMSRLHRYAYRPWATEREVRTVCPYCGVGCSVVLQTKEERIQRVVPGKGAGSNQGILCSRGFFGYEYVGSGERLDTPLIKESGGFREATWEEALDLVSRRLLEIKQQHGGSSIAGIASTRCTNEENYLFQKLMRTAFNTNNIDSTARLGLAGARRFLDEVLGQGSTANLVAGVAHSDAVLVAGGDPTRLTPVLGVRVRNAYRFGAKVITIGYNPGLEIHSTTALMPRPRTEGIAMAAILGEMLKSRKLPGEDLGLEETIKSIKLPTMEEAASVCSSSGLLRACDELSGASSVSIIAGSGLISHSDGGRNLLVIAALAYVLKARIYLVSEGPNENGLLDMGCVPDMLPGEMPVANQAFRHRCETAWGSPVSMTPGKALMDIMEGAPNGHVKAMYVMGSNPAFNLPDSGLATEALRGLDFLVVQDIFMTETAELAHVVLPAMGWAEKEGTFTNLERRIQVLGQAVTGKGMEDWKILSGIGTRAGVEMPYLSAEDIMAEIATVSPLHSGLTYGDIRDGMDLWPYKGEPVSHASRLEPEKLLEKPSVPEPEGLYLMLESPLFHSGTMSRRSQALMDVYPAPSAGVNPKTAEKISALEGDAVEVSTARGSLMLPLRIERGIPEHTVLLTNNFKSTGFFSLLMYNKEPLTGAPVPAAAEARIKKVG